MSLLTALAGALTGCGVSTSLDPVASAATKTENVGASRVSFSATFSSPSLAGGSELTMHGSGFASKEGSELTIDMSDVLQQAGASPGSDGTMKEIFLSESGHYVIYLQAGLFGQLPDGKHWVRIDLSKVSSKLGVDFEKLMGGQAAQDPAQMLAMLRATSGQVDEVGRETIDGAATTHYRATVDLDKAARLRGISSEALQQLTGRRGMPATVPEDVWIGEDGLVRQFRFSYSTKNGDAPIDMTMTVGLSDYGTSAAVTAPDANDVFDVSDLAAQGIEQQQGANP